MRRIVPLVLACVLFGCGEDAFENDAPANDDVLAGRHGLDALAAWRRGDIDETIRQLKIATETRDPPIDPHLVAGGYVALVPVADPETPVGAMIVDAARWLDRGDYAKAAGLLIRAMAEEETRAEPHVLQGFSMLARGKTGAALGAFTAALRIEPDNWRAALGKHVAHARRDEGAARTYLQRAGGKASGTPTVLGWYEARDRIAEGSEQPARRLLESLPRTK